MHRKNETFLKLFEFLFVHSVQSLNRHAEQLASLFMQISLTELKILVKANIEELLLFKLGFSYSMFSLKVLFGCVKVNENRLRTVYKMNMKNERFCGKKLICNRILGSI